MNPETLNAMKEAAAKAEPGPWRYRGDKSIYSWTTRRFAIPHSDADAQFIALCDPQTVSALIAERDALAASRRVHELDNHHNALACGYCSGPLKDELLRAQAEVERQAGEIERLRKWQGDVEEREAAVCPEDVAFDEYIRALRTALLPLASVHVEGSDPNEAVFVRGGSWILGSDLARAFEMLRD
jgi:hypothetical protein